MYYELKIIPVELLEAYCLQVRKDLELGFQDLKEAEISTATFSFYTSVASVYSSKIEGEDIDLDSYIKHKRFGIAFLPDYTKKIDDLYLAYEFAKANTLNASNISFVHQLLSKHILAKVNQGKLRTCNMYVATADGRIAYFATPPFKVEEEMQKFYADLALLTSRKLTIEEVFFFAAMIHLVFVKIHPFNDGNGRMGRLLEKWFLAHQLGPKAWFLTSEKMYYNNHDIYYQNLRALGVEYEELDYQKALPFLLMLPQALSNV